MAQEVAVAGYARVTVTRLTKSASVSTRDFYEHFEGKEDCYLATFDAIRDHLADLIERAAAAEPDWPHQVVAALRAVVEFFADEPDLARLFLLESISATQTIAAHFRETVLSCAPALARGRGEMADPASLLPDGESAIVGGAVSLVTRRIVAGETDQLPRLLPDLIEFTLSPYLGEERALDLAAEISPD
jgi:AcrR family transcriptional regulator